MSESVRLLLSVGQVVLVTLALSGDNAVALALAISRLAPTQRRRAVIVGGGTAILVCVGLGLGGSALLSVPGLKVAGGCVLLALGVLQLRGGQPAQLTGVRLGGRRGASLTLFLVEMSVSFDNVLGATAAAGGDLLALAIGLAAGMALALGGGVQLARVFTRSALLPVVAAGIVAWAGARLAADDALLADRRLLVQPLVWLAPLGVVVAGLVRLNRSGSPP